MVNCSIKWKPYLLRLRFRFAGVGRSLRIKLMVVPTLGRGMGHGVLLLWRESPSTCSVLTTLAVVVLDSVDVKTELETSIERFVAAFVWSCYRWIFRGEVWKSRWCIILIRSDVWCCCWICPARPSAFASS